jgi:hypothetical protein
MLRRTFDIHEMEEFLIASGEMPSPEIMHQFATQLREERPAMEFGDDCANVVDLHLRRRPPGTRKCQSSHLTELHRQDAKESCTYAPGYRKLSRYRML